MIGRVVIRAIRRHPGLRGVTQLSNAAVALAALDASEGERAAYVCQMEENRERVLSDLLRLEIAADVPTPADQLSARRMYQLQLLTKRNEAAPTQTWGQDAAQVLASGFDATAARRLQNALKALLKKA